MRTRKLGRSSLEVPVVSFGAWAIGGWYWGGADPATGLRALGAAIDEGITAVDTAPIYGFGLSEQLVGRAIAVRRDDVVVMTKAGLRWDDGPGEPFFETEGPGGRRVTIRRDSSPESLRREVEASLKRLNVTVIDLLQVHWPDPRTPIAETMGALVDLRREGKIREIGVSNFDAPLLAEALAALGDVPLASVQTRYSLLRTDAEAGVLPFAREHGLGVLAYSPLEQGLLTGKVSDSRRFAADDGRAKQVLFSAANRAAVNRALTDHIEPVARAHDATVAQVVIACTAEQPGITTVLVGARDEEQARENARGGELVLGEGEVAAVRAALAGVTIEQPAPAAPAPKGGMLGRLFGRLRGKD